MMMMMMMAVMVMAMVMMMMKKNCRLSDEGGSEMTRASSSSSAISNLTDELLIEILCRLGSSKYAVHCKLVSKLWLSLINTDSRSSYFMRGWHRINHREDDELPEILLTQYETVTQLDGYHYPIDYMHKTTYLNESHSEELPSFKSLNFLPEEYPIFVIGTYKDLVHCCPLREDIRVHYICNPFTMQYTALPPRPQASDSEYIFGSTLYVYDDDDGQSFKFKVVNFTYDLENGSTKVDIFSSEDSAWRVINITNEWIDVPYYGYQFVPYNGLILWPLDDHLVGFKINPEDDGHDDYDANFTRIPHPADDPNPHIGLVGGRLRLAEMVGDEFANLKLKIWELNNEWELVHELGFSDMEDSDDLSTFKSCSLYSTTLCFPLQDDGDVLYLFCNLEEGEGEEEEEYTHTFYCNLRKRTLQMVRGPPSVRKYFYLSMPSWPSPVPLLPPP